MKFPPPPEPPTVAEEFLHQLADYYRQLVEYHQRAATAAAQQLAHLEALLHPERLLDFPKDVPYWQLPVASDQSRSVAPHEAISVTNEQESLTGHCESVTAATRQLLEEGATQGKWCAVPDSPDCWTIDLKDFPDLAATKPDQGRSKPQAKHSLRTIPDCEKLVQYGTVKAAIAACLEEHSPVPMTIWQVVDWFYPQGQPSEVRRKAYGAISKALSDGCDRLGWRRVSPGRYVWKQSGKG